MKKLITILIILILFACSKEVKTDQFTLSGMLSNVTEGKFHIIGNSYSKEIILNEDGTFTDTLKLPYNGTYLITAANLTLYLESGKKLNLIIDVDEADKSTFSGELEAENTYLLHKQNLRKDILGTKRKELYGLPENEFLAKIENLFTKTTELLESSTFNSANFKEQELKNTKYSKTLLLQKYPYYHKYFTKNKAFVVSNTYPKINETIDFDNVDDFNFSGAYRDLVQNDFDTKVKEAVDSGADRNVATIEFLKAIKNQNIKNELVEKASFYLNSDTKNLNEIYSQFLTLSTNKTFKTSLTNKYNKIKLLSKGQPSPKFNYENHKGGTTSLIDLKGKYVYVDVWATWCEPCIAEIPALKAIEEKYKDKNIEFVGISIDDVKDYEKWKSFVTKKELAGIQLFADDSWDSDFIKSYAIEGIPRFILIDPNGNIVSSDAPRPSDTKLITLFDDLNI